MKVALLLSLTKFTNSISEYRFCIQLSHLYSISAMCRLWCELYARFEFEFYPSERTPLSTADSQSTALLKSSSSSAFARSNGITISEEDEQLFSVSSSSSSRGFTAGFTPDFEGELVCVRTRFEHMRAVERLVLFYQNVR